MAHTWDPGTYLEYGDERARPFMDLVARVGATDPRSVVDLGCGTGHLTTLLKRRWPEADVVGVDSSHEMVAAAEPDTGVRMVVGDLREWRAETPVDVLVSNAALQWVPDHLALLPLLVDQLAEGGWFAFQVPGNFSAPSHALRHELEHDERFASYLDGVTGPGAHDPEVYLEALLDLGCEVDAWETTYLHLLEGDDPVFTWAVGTGARPTLEALPDGPRQEFEDDFRRGLRDAYPATRHGTLLPFRRVFVVARRSGKRAP
jgi:trans-aconitate 2-methyltransferase